MIIFEDMNQRNLAIDIFRGLTMALMVFVNDFWTVLDVPHFLEHYATWEDGMGLSDYIYPMFLFAMGMSVPCALDRRKDAPAEKTLRHILSRTLALVVMGSFIVNAEGEIAPLLGYDKGVYWLLMLVGFFLVWNAYPKEFAARRWLQGAGMAVLAFLAVTFRSPGGALFQGQWWGILGQIGWMYLFAATAYLLCRERPWVLGVLWGVFAFVNITVAPMRDGTALIGPNWLADLSSALQMGNGHSIVMTIGGMLTVLAERRLRRRKVLAGLTAAMVLAAMGTAVHGGWIISKNIGTLPWCLYVSAVSVALYTLFRVLEARGLTAWARPLNPAGTATLTVYMVPYLFYSLWVFFSPDIWISGWAGVLKCFLFSALCIATAAGLKRIGIQLKI